MTQAETADVVGVWPGSRPPSSPVTFATWRRGWNGPLGLSDEEQLWTKPFPFGNSIGHLVLHLTGNLNHYIGALIARFGLRPRSRARVHRPDSGYPREELLARFHQAVDMVVKTLEAQDESFIRRIGARPAADSNSSWAFPRVRRPHEQPHWPDELPGPSLNTSTGRAPRDGESRTAARGSIP